jgi:hypothetical protein
MHIHLSALDALIFTLYLLIVGFLLRTIAGRNSDNALGKALAFIY